MRLYWVDAFFDKIEYSSFDGQNRISLDRITQISHPFGLTIFEGNKPWHKQQAAYKVPVDYHIFDLNKKRVNFTGIELNYGLSFLL